MRVPRGTCFFTVALGERRSSLLTDRIDALRSAYASVLINRPFRCDAMVVLPDHFHCVWTLPAGDEDFSTRIRCLKAAFSRSVNPERRLSRRDGALRDSGVWRKRFWAHAIRDEADYRAHVEYCWMNPVKHGLVADPADWPHSSLHAAIRRGVAPPAWRGAIREGDFGEAA